MEKRKAKLVLNKSGNGSSTFRATLPTKWIRQMGLDEENRDVEIKFKDDKIIIRKS